MSLFVRFYLAVSWTAFFWMLFLALGDPRLADGLIHWNESYWWEKLIGINAAISMLLAVGFLLFKRNTKGTT